MAKPAVYPQNRRSLIDDGANYFVTLFTNGPQRGFSRANCVAGSSAAQATCARVFSVVGFCLGRQIADVVERLLSGEPAPDRKGVDGEAEEGDGKDVPAEGELVTGTVKAE